MTSGRACDDGSGTSRPPIQPATRLRNRIALVVPTAVRGAGGTHLHHRGDDRALGRGDVRRGHRGDGRFTPRLGRELAGAVMATGLIAWRSRPLTGRLVDRYGQRRVAVPFFIWSGFWAALTMIASWQGWPAWILFITFPLCAVIPNLGTMARAGGRTSSPTSRASCTAMSFEQVMEEVTFVIGPVLAIWLSTSVFPEAGFLFATICYAIGVLVFVSARSTEPPVVPHHERPHGPHTTTPGSSRSRSSW